MTILCNKNNKSKETAHVLYPNNSHMGTQQRTLSITIANYLTEESMYLLKA